MKRRVLFWVHLSLGIVAALYAIAIGCSGALLVCEDDWLRLAYPQFHAGQAGAISASEALAATERTMPGWLVLTLTFPNAGSPNWMAYLIRGREARQLWVDSRTGAVLGERDPAGDWLGWCSRLHANLHSGRTGRLVNGYGSILLVVLTLTGILLWTPSWPVWRQRFRWSRSWPWNRNFYNLHHSVGLLAAPVVLLTALTGTYYVWLSDYVKLVDRLAVRTKEPLLPKRPGNLLAPDALVAQARAAIPGAIPHRLQIVHATNQPVRVTLREGHPREFHWVSTVFLDPVDGTPLQVVRLESRPAGDAILGWISALHFGVFGGRLVQGVWIASALALPVLAISGLALSLRRARIL